MAICVVSKFEILPYYWVLTILEMAFRTDPPKMDIYLVNQNVYPNTQVLIASGVDTSLGEYTIKAKDVKDVDTG